MRRLQFLLATFPLIITLSAAFADNGGKSLSLRSVATPIIVDGEIDAAWSGADSVSDFVQFQPYHGKEPTRKTTAKLLTKGDALQCLIVCYDNGNAIQQSTGTLDQFNGDVVSLMLDTFGDDRTAYKFAVSASGVRMDARLLEDARDRDYNWDGIWFASSRVYDWGYVVEMEIPYKSIKYTAELNEWGLDFDRWIPGANEDIYWCSYEENEGQRISKFGKLRFENFTPTAKGLNLEIYPVAIGKATYLREGTYRVKPDAGIDIFYNPSEQLTFQLTANPDFAQIEADPFEFNISRYESYYSERRPFFTEGNEIFMASGKQRNSGFYSPLELLYSRRIGKKLPDGSEVPIILGTKAFGRIGEWEYGGFLAMTGSKEFDRGLGTETEPSARFGSVRLRKQILENSSLGLLFVGKHSEGNNNGVIDIDGAFRSSNWQLAYQIARSYRDNAGDFAGSAGLKISTDNWLTAVRGRFIGNAFDISDVGFVPWKGTAEFVGLSGPRWFMKEGTVREIGIYGGPILSYEEADLYTDRGALLGLNMQFRNNWGFEVNIDAIRAKDQHILYDAYDISSSAWFNIDPRWDASMWFNYSRTYNFARDFLAYFISTGGSVSWRPFDILEVGSSYNMFIEGSPGGSIEDITHNARPYFSLTPVNYLNIRVYLDNLYVRSTDRMEQMIGGLLFSYNFLPKSWIYFAINEVRDRSEEFDGTGTLVRNRLHVTDRAAVLKLKYLYYF